jgi:hypothetical protein
MSAAVTMHRFEANVSYSLSLCAPAELQTLADDASAATFCLDYQRPPGS